MAMPRQVSKKLRQILGEEDGGAMSEWLDDLDSKSDEFRRDMRADFAEVRQEIHALREELRVGFAELRGADAVLREEMRTGLTEMRGAMAVQMAEFQKQTTDAYKHMTDALRWGIGIWISSFVAIVGVLAFIAQR